MSLSDELKATPVGFALEVLKVKGGLYPWQADALTPLEQCHQKRVKITVCTPNGAGKSERVVACAAIWWLAVHARGTVVITTADSKQLDNQIWPAIEAARGKFPQWKWRDREVDTPTGGRIRAFTTDEAGRAEGWHKVDDVDGPLLIIADEAKSIPEGIFQAIDRCTFNALIYTSSPGLMSGRFFDSHTKLTGWVRVQVGLADCPHIEKQKIDDLREQYGEAHPFFRSTAHGEFMDADGDSSFVFPLRELQSARLNLDVQAISGPPVAFCDFAAGGDENVLAVRKGNKVEIAAAWREPDTSKTVGKFILEFRRLGIEPHRIFADEGGIGRPMCDLLRDMGWNVNRVNNGSAPIGEGYQNRGAEMWYQTAAALRKGECILPLDDDKLFDQLRKRKVTLGPRGQAGVEKKEDLRKRGETSPDRADAVCGAWANVPLADLVARNRANPESWLEWEREQHGEGQEAAFSGCNAGY